MKTLEDVMTEWTKDSDIDESEPGRALIAIAKLHAKYLNFLVTNTAVSKTVSFQIAQRKKLLFHYYAGLMDETELAEAGMEQWPHKTLRQDISIYVDADEKLNNLLLKKANADSIIDYCDRVLKELHSRTYQLKSFIDWERFIRSA